MEGWPLNFWGKFREDPKRGPQWHPLADHCADVAACMEALLEQQTIRARLARTGGLPDLDSGQRARLSVLAAIHDLGKFNRGFQAKIHQNSKIKAGHVREAVALLTHPGPILSNLESLGLSGWASDDSTPWRLLWAALSHHGRPVGESPSLDSSLWAPAGSLDPAVAVARLLEKVKVWFPGAFAPAVPPLPDNPQFQHTYSGLVMLADWIGSDTKFFPFSSDGDRNRIELSRTAARAALASVGLDSSAARHSLGSRLPGFEACFGPHRPNAMQVAVESIDLERFCDSGSVAVLEAETGSGKTEAAFRHFLRLFHRGLVDGLYFALPTRAAATQIHGRICQAARAALGDKAPPVVLAVPGYLRVDDYQGQRLPGFDVLWPDEAARRGWAAEHPKRYMAAGVLVGTIDQVLLSCLRVGHAQMRASTLMRHLLVIDEVHASDVYMSALLDRVLEHHVRQAGGHALLMSATLGSVMRERVWAGQRAAPPTLDAAVRAPYPALFVKCGAHPVSSPPIGPACGAAKRVCVRLLGVSDDESELAAICVEHALAGARVLVVRNLVKSAVELERAFELKLGLESPLLFKVGRAPAPHHSRFAPEDRRALDEQVEARLGKSSPAGPAMVVATQTVEQSLDIDADLLVTDLCPMDVLLQRIGRLWRHPSRTRPSCVTGPAVLVVTPDMASADLSSFLGQDGKGRGPRGIGTVYRDLRILQATWLELEAHPTLTLPDQNRLLVERSTHPDRLTEISATAASAWGRHEATLVGKAAAEAGLAHANLIPRDKTFGTADLAFDDAAELRISSRLGEGDTSVRFEPPFDSPFGNRLSELRIPRWLAPEAPEESVASDVEAVDGGIAFFVGARRMRYDRFGLGTFEGPEEET